MTDGLAVAAPTLMEVAAVWRSPLEGQTRLTGGRVDDEWGRAVIRAEMEFCARPWWRRVGRRPSLPVAAAPALSLPVIDMPSPEQDPA